MKRFHVPGPAGLPLMSDVIATLFARTGQHAVTVCAGEREKCYLDQAFRRAAAELTMECPDALESVETSLPAREVPPWTARLLRDVMAFLISLGDGKPGAALRARLDGRGWVELRLHYPGGRAMAVDDEDEPGGGAGASDAVFDLLLQMGGDFRLEVEERDVAVSLRLPVTGLGAAAYPV